MDKNKFEEAQKITEDMGKLQRRLNTVDKLLQSACTLSITVAGMIPHRQGFTEVHISAKAAAKGLLKAERDKLELEIVTLDKEFKAI